MVSSTTLRLTLVDVSIAGWQDIGEGVSGARMVVLFMILKLVDV